MFALWLRKCGSSGSAAVYTLHKWLTSYCFLAQVAQVMREGVWPEVVLGTIDNRHRVRQSLWDEWRSVSRCPTKWSVFLLRLNNYKLHTRDTKASMGYSDRQKPLLWWLPIGLCRLKCAATTAVTEMSTVWCRHSMIYAVCATTVYFCCNIPWVVYRVGGYGRTTITCDVSQFVLYF